MMRSDDPPPAPAPAPNPIATTIAIAIVTAACTTAATKLAEWGVEKLRARFDAPKKTERKR